MPDLTPLDFCLLGCMNSEVYKREVDARDKLLACNLDAATRINKCNVHCNKFVI